MPDRTGTDSGESILGSVGEDVIDGRGGDDILEGGSGADRYVFGANFGSDIIDDDAGRGKAGDIVEFKNDRLSDASVRETANDLVITTPNGTVRVRGFERAENGIELFQFKDKIAIFDGNRLINPIDAWNAELSKARSTASASDKEWMDEASLVMNSKSREDQEAFAFVGLAAAKATETKSGRELLNDVKTSVEDNKLEAAGKLLGLPNGSTAGEIREFALLPVAGALVGAGAVVAFAPAVTVGALAYAAVTGATAAITGSKIAGTIIGIAERAFGGSGGGGDDDGREPNGGQVPNADPGVGRNDVPDSFPVVLDLDRDGSLDLVSNDRGGWVGPSDGFLAVDRDGSGAIDDLSEIAFVEEDPRARTDLEGLAYGFDGNGDGVVNNQDERFSELQVFQDVDGDGVSSANELMTLEEAGITSIDVSSVPYEGEPSVIQEKAGNQVFGVTTVAHEDGSFSIAGDVVLGHDQTSVAEGTVDGVPGDAVEQLTVDVASLTATVDKLTSAIAAMSIEDGYSWRHNSQTNHPIPTLHAA